jgi:tripartite-type tricarboxylate transporter receptor subunit TctC
VMGGHVDIGVYSTVGLNKLVEDKMVKALGVFAEERHRTLPDLLTAKEQGYPATSTLKEFIAAPKDTPEHIVKYYREKLKEIFADPDYIAGMDKLGSDPAHMEPETIDSVLKKDFEELGKVIEAAGLKK